jgi:hypothetical protein
MSHNFLSKSSFHEILNLVDQKLAEQSKEKGCLNCSNPLHQANYPRSPAGLTAPFREYYDERLSFCCAKCRKRMTPPSVRFFGRRWFVGPVFIFICILRLGINARRMAQVKKHFGITMSQLTWKRWRQWWRESFPETAFWQRVKGIIPLYSIESEFAFPRALFNQFSGFLEQKIESSLRFFSAAPGSVLRAF